MASYRKSVRDATPTYRGSRNREIRPYKLSRLDCHKSGRESMEQQHAGSRARRVKVIVRFPTQPPKDCLEHGILQRLPWFLLDSGGCRYSEAFKAIIRTEPWIDCLGLLVLFS